MSILTKKIPKKSSDLKTIILRLIILTLFALSANADDTENGNATAFEERKFSLCAREEKVKLC